MLQADGLQLQEEVRKNADNACQKRINLLILLGSGIGLMLARGCAANGAHTILIDVNQEALKEAKAEIEGIIQASEDSNSAQVITLVVFFICTIQKGRY